MSDTNDALFSREVYAIHAVRDGVQLPTFYLDPNVQGIMSTGHACDIARMIVGSDCDVTATRI